MPRSLILLLKLRLKGRIRRMLGRSKKVRSILVMVIGAVMLVPWILSIVLSTRGKASFSGSVVMDWGPLGLLLILALNVITPGGNKGLTFSPAEIDMLFPGPFTRRQLVGYRLIVQVFMVLLFSPLMALWVRGFSSSPLTGWLFCVCVFVFIQLLNISVSLARRTRAGGIFVNVMRLVLLALVVLVAMTIADGADRESFLRLKQHVMDARWSIPGIIVLAPLSVFWQVASAPPLEALLWFVGAVGICGGMVMLIFRLDSAGLDHAISNSQEIAARLERMRATGKIGSIGAKAARRRIPVLPRLYGAGPVFWRQLSYAIRSKAWLLIVAVPLAVGAAWYFAGSSLAAMGAILGNIGFVIVFVVSGSQRFDFRGDLDQIGLLKSLPLASGAVALGQVLCPVLIVSLMLWGGAVVSAAMNPAWIPYLVPFSLFAPLLVAILVATDNFLFLLFPMRGMPSGPFDVQFLGRAMIVLFAKMGIVAAAVAPLVGIVFLVKWLSGSAIAALAVALPLIVIEVAVLVGMLAWAYRRFDVTRDLPA